MGPPIQKHERTLCGTIEKATYEAREKREMRKKQPWLVLKFMVGITSAIIGYAGYVYIGRFCVPMILRHPDALGSRSMGIAFIIVFAVLLLMMIWAYIKVVFTSPGNAALYVHKSPQPIIGAEPTRPMSFDSRTDIGGPRYSGVSVLAEADLEGQNTVSGETANDKPSRASSPKEKSHYSPTRSHDPDDQNGEVLDTLHPTIPTSVTANGAPPQNGAPVESSPPGQLVDMRPGGLTRRPSTTPVLDPAHRWCSKCEIIKPYRAHHCRACGTCVLKYDHHCPWIGQCCGARNHKFFLNFSQWACLFCIWTFSTLLARNVQAMSRPGFNMDPEHIVIVAIAGLFLIFTLMLAAAHTMLILRNQSTVESLITTTQRERDQAALDHIFPWYKIRARAQTVRDWDREWGRLRYEGNIWWLGSARKNWESVMGTAAWKWFLPLGGIPTDGLSYPVNPRFDTDGRWRKRSEWPAELR